MPSHARTTHAPRRRRRATSSPTAPRARQAAGVAADRAGHRQLESWFAATAAAPAPTETSFARLGLPQRLVTALERRDIRTAFPIQAATLADALDGRDVLGRARTGSGKTLAFGLPVLARLCARRTGGPASGRPSALVLVPTRELAGQVRDVLEPLGHAVGVKTVAVFGGAPIGRQVAALGKGVDLVVATPGRLLDLIGQGACSLTDVEVCVLDEADHMADMGFLPDVTRLLDMTRRDCQRLLFSATLDGAVGRLVRRYLTDPAAHAVDPAESQVPEMEHRALVVRPDDKVAVLAEITARPARTLLFVRTKHGADRLAKQLGRLGVDALAIHGNRTQGQRQRALDAFTRGQVRVLVATDVAARGIHVADVDLVVHVDPPNDHKDYLHRSGRTARAGTSGVVVSTLSPNQVPAARRMFGNAGLRVDEHPGHPGAPAVRTIAESGAPVAVLPAAANPSPPVRRVGDQAGRRPVRNRRRRGGQGGRRAA